MIDKDEQIRSFMKDRRRQKIGELAGTPGLAYEIQQK